MIIKKTAGSWIFDCINNLFLMFVIIAMLSPFLHVASVSISDKIAVVNNKISLFPIGLDFDAYRKVFENEYIFISYKNTIIYTVVGTLVNLILTAMVAYPLSKKFFFGRKQFTMLITFTMFFGGGMIPGYLLVKSLGIMNSMWAVILPGAVSTWNMIIMRTFFQNIPDSLEESAVIDGCTEIGVLFKIILPLSMPIMSTMGLFYAVGHWNSFFGPLLYLNDKAKYPLQIILRQIVISGEMAFAQGSSSGEEIVIADSVKYATIMVATLPIIMIYPFIQKYFVKGVMVGSIKG